MNSPVVQNTAGNAPAFTPGPWTVIDTFNPELPWCAAKIVGPGHIEGGDNIDQNPVAYVQNTLANDARDTARLIAAAPTQNKALAAICDLFFMCAVNGDEDRPLMPTREQIVAAYEIARLALDGTHEQTCAAIAKATGQA